MWAITAHCMNTHCCYYFWVRRYACRISPRLAGGCWPKSPRILESCCCQSCDVLVFWALALIIHYVVAPCFPSKCVTSRYPAMFLSVRVAAACVRAQACLSMQTKPGAKACPPRRLMSECCQCVYDRCLRSSASACALSQLGAGRPVCYVDERELLGYSHCGADPRITRPQGCTPVSTL